LKIQYHNRNLDLVKAGYCRENWSMLSFEDWKI